MEDGSLIDQVVVSNCRSPRLPNDVNKGMHPVRSIVALQMALCLVDNIYIEGLDGVVVIRERVHILNCGVLQVVLE